MKKEELLSLVAALANMGTIKADDGAFYVYDAKRAVWHCLRKKEVALKLSELVAAVRPGLTFDELNVLKKELLVHPEFVQDFRGKALYERRIHAGGLLLGIDGDEITTERASRDDFIAETLNFQFRASAKLVEAPTWMEFLQHSFAIKADLTKSGPALAMEASKILEHSSVRRLFEFLGYAVSPPGIWGAKKMMVLLGPPNTGKSQIVELVRRVKGKTGCVSMTPHDLADRFRSGMLLDASIVLNDEMPTTGLKHLDTLKKAIAGEELTCERKGVDPVTFCPRVKMLFAGNQLPELSEPDFGNAFANRLVVVNFSHPVGAEKRNIHLADAFFEERDVIFSLAVKHLLTLRKHNFCFTQDAAGDEAVAVYRAENSSVALFLDLEMDAVERGTGLIVSSEDLFNGYKTFCNQNAITPCNLREFHEQLRQMGFHKVKKRLRKGGNPRYVYEGLALKWMTGGIENESI